MSRHVSVYLDDEREALYLKEVGGDDKQLRPFLLQCTDEHFRKGKRFDIAVNYAMFLVGTSFLLSFAGNAFIPEIWSVWYGVSIMSGGLLLVIVSVGKLLNGKVKKNGYIDTVNTT